MNDSTEQNGADASPLAGHRLPEPTPELKDRVLGAARAAWAEAVPESGEVLWFYPVLRLAASVVIAVGLIHFANTTGGKPVTAAPVSLQGLDARARLAAIAASRPSESAARALIGHQRRMDALLHLDDSRNG